MPYPTPSLREIGREASDNASRKGFDRPNLDTLAALHAQGPPEVPVRAARVLIADLGLIHTEVSEAIEAVRNRDTDNLREELADVVIRAASLAAELGFDLDSLIDSKLHANRSRAFRHGGKVL